MKFLQNLFQTVTNNLIYSKTALEKKNLRRSKIGGGSGVGMTAVKDSTFFVFLTPSLIRTLTDRMETTVAEAAVTTDQGCDVSAFYAN